MALNNRGSVPEDCILIGRIGAAFGVKGWNRIFPQTEPKSGIFGYVPWQLEIAGSWQAVTWKDWKPQGKGWVVCLGESETRETADFYRNAWVAAPKSALPETDEDEFYYFQLEGLKLLTLDGHCLGRVKSLFNTGSNDVMVVTPTSESLDDRTRLIPYLAPYVVSTDLDQAEIRVDWALDF